MVIGSEVERALQRVRRTVERACGRAGRDPADVRLIGVTKTVRPELVRAANEAGLQEFGENYVQELEGKRRIAPQARWHYLGRLQSNKVGRVLEAADVVQTLEPGRAVDRLAERARDRGAPLSCLVEVDFTGRRVGVSPDEAEEFIERLTEAPGLRIEGLMTIPPLGELPRRYFAALRELRERLGRRFPTLVELSMGMSADYEEAVEEGATMVRVGTAIFGARPEGGADGRGVA